MRPETIEKCNKMRALIAEGKTNQAALDEVKISSATWHSFLKNEKKGSRKTKTPTFIDLKPRGQSKVAVVLCDFDQVSSVIESLR